MFLYEIKKTKVSKLKLKLKLSQTKKIHILSFVGQLEVFNFDTFF